MKYKIGEENRQYYKYGKVTEHVTTPIDGMPPFDVDEHLLDVMDQERKKEAIIRALKNKPRNTILLWRFCR